MKGAIQVGDSVRLTGAFLRNTGQQRGAEGRKVWKVRALDGRFVIVDEEFPADVLARLWPDIPKGHPEFESIRFRRIVVANLQRVAS